VRAASSRSWNASRTARADERPRRERAATPARVRTDPRPRGSVLLRSRHAGLHRSARPDEGAAAAPASPIRSDQRRRARTPSSMCVLLVIIIAAAAIVRRRRRSRAACELGSGSARSAPASRRRGQSTLAPQAHERPGTIPSGRSCLGRGMLFASLWVLWIGLWVGFVLGVLFALAMKRLQRTSALARIVRQEGCGSSRTGGHDDPERPRVPAPGGVPRSGGLRSVDRIV
jgi:hypothetical protein